MFDFCSDMKTELREGRGPIIVEWKVGKLCCWLQSTYKDGKIKRTG